MSDWVAWLRLNVPRAVALPGRWLVLPNEHEATCRLHGDPRIAKVSRVVADAKDSVALALMLRRAGYPTRLDGVEGFEAELRELAESELVDD